MKNEKVLEFNVIKETLKNYATLVLNKENILDLRIITDKEILKKELNKTDEASRILLRHGRIIIEELNDIYFSVDKVNKNFVLSIDELYDIKNCLKVVKENINFAKNIERNEFVNFFELIDNFKVCNELNNNLVKSISDNKQIKDEASSNLKRIRKEIKGLESEIREKLLKLINTYSSILNDTNILYKNGKQVLAVKSSEKNKLGGIVVDESNTGFTSYVEPEVVYKITSKINVLKNEENEEIQKILRFLSGLVLNYSSELNDNFTSLLELDFMFAKGEYCNKTESKIATLSDGELKLIEAKHPLIEKEKVVSNNFYLSDNDKKVLIISGPNTGGKSVALKTVGILSYMNQCGLAIPVKEAILPVFDNIYVDIGDNQSIIFSLSTFSSHISNISYILNHITNKSLVLLDEVGAGTDPSEGEALAMAIIDYCHKKNCYLLSSTHYDNLKTFAINKDYVEVSSMEFDKVNLKPTYRLLKGQIGKSYALEISSRYGINKEIINKAYEYKEEYATSTEKMLRKLEIKLEEQQKLIDNYEEKNEMLNNLIKENKEKEIELKKQIEEIKQRANEEINELIKDSKEEINSILKEIREKDNIKMHEALIANKKLNGLVIEEESEEIETQGFKIGDSVKIVSLMKTGEIVSINKNKYGVNIGNLTLNVDGSDLEKYKVKPKTKPNKVTISSKVKSVKMSMELNLIGKRVEEALIELETYIDKARAMRLPSVRIIHGYGTGRLQKAVHEYLKKLSNIEYHFGGQNDGGMGSTIVIFEKKVN